MKLLFKQRFFSWFDSFDIFDEDGNTVYTVEGQLSWGHCLKIFDTAGNEIGTVKEEIFTFLPKFEMYLGENYLGCISKEFTFFKPAFNIDCNGWHVEGDFFEWDYSIIGPQNETVATVSKELWNWTDTYVIDINDPRDAIETLMLVIAIEAEKCSRD
ncbi:MAG: LURP-one-related family protein [Oscillospiraceae bacterium]|nr:LURP-one-related family protein [Oscillospiraceae bacterium]